MLLLKTSRLYLTVLPRGNRGKYMPNQSFIEEIIDNVHIKWLSKGETTKIKGQEMTVLPYGYLRQAVKESLELQKEKIIEEIEKLITENNLQGFNQCGYDYDLAIARSLEIVKSL